MRRRVLLDEQLPVALRLWLPAVAAVTVAYRGWKGLPDDELLAAARGEIDVLLTFDAALVRERPEWRGICGIVLLRGANVLPALQAAAPRIEAACLAVGPGELQEVEVPAAVP
jgi:predicted nuclease of predicted toxin-antitoxin system